MAWSRLLFQGSLLYAFLADFGRVVAEIMPVSTSNTPCKAYAPEPFRCAWVGLSGLSSPVISAASASVRHGASRSADEVFVRSALLDMTGGIDSSRSTSMEY